MPFPTLHMIRMLIHVLPLFGLLCLACDSEVSKGTGSAASCPGRAGAFHEQQALEGDWSIDPRGFGYSFALDGDRAVVGAPWSDRGGTLTGTAAVIEKVDGVWTHVQNLYPGEAFDEAEFGRSVAISGDTVVVGSMEKGEYDAYNGAVHIFEKSAEGIWHEVQRIARNYDGEGDVYFRNGLSIEGDTLATTWLSCSYVEMTCYPQVVLYSRVGGTWSEQQVLDMSPPEIILLIDWYTMAVALDGSELFVGLPWHSQEPGGSVLIFEEEGGRMVLCADAGS